MIDHWWQWMVAMTWQISLIIIIIAAFCYFSRRTSAKALYFLWLLILVKLVLPPSLGHNYSLSNLISGLIDSSKQDEKNYYSTTNQTVYAAKISANQTQYTTLNEMAITGFLKLEKPVSVSSPEGNAFSLRRFISGIPFKRVFFIIWISGIGLFLIPMLINLHRFRRWLVACKQQPTKWFEERLFTLSREVGLKKPPQCIIIPDAFSPCIFGWFKPKLLFTKYLLDNLTQEQLRMAVFHELIHIKKKRYNHKRSAKLDTIHLLV